jgi:TonB family protein
MGGLMGPLPDSAPTAAQACLPGQPRVPSLAVAWPSPQREFATSLRALFGPRAPNKAPFSGSPYLTIYWIRGGFPGRAFMASSLWHVAAILIALLPIWSFLLPAVKPTLAPVRIELTWYPPAQDLPEISLPAPAAKLQRAKPAAELREVRLHRGADAFHPRQTILSIPLRVTHPRQTLIQPKAPPTAPKIVPQLPNIVEWAGASAPARPELHLTPTASAPKIRQRKVRDVAAPEVAANLEKNVGPLNIAAATPVAQPQMPLAPMSAPIASRRMHEDVAAPDVAAGSFGDSSLHQVIALSAAPAPPAPEVSVPEGNLSARISISPEGTRPGVPGGAEHGAPTGNGTIGATSGSGGGMGAAGGGNGLASGAGSGGNASGVPAGISISGGSGTHPIGGGAGLPGSRTGGLILKPMTSAPPRPDPGTYAARRTSPAPTRTFDSNTPPEKILWDKQVYTLYVNMPNMTSVTGSWVLDFAQLDDDSPPYIKKPPLSGPVPMRKVDPKYPPEMIQAHVEGEVVLYAIIRKDGSIDSIQVVHSLDPQLDVNSMQALASWKFRPATREGVPVELETVVHIPFRFRAP